MNDDNENTVNQVFDDKGPLKGKGWTVRQWRDDARSRLEQVYSQMAELVAETDSIVGREFGLKLYALRDAKQLRWRFTRGRHATWSSVEPALAQMAPALSRWYRQAQEAAQILNHREQVIRYELKTVDRLLNHGQDREARTYLTTVGKGFGGGRPQRTHDPSEYKTAAAAE